MIISHTHECIFVKTGKTAGTSLEIALSKFCGPDDVITPLTDDDEATRRQLGYRGPQHYHKTWRDWNVRDVGRLLIRQRTPQPIFYNHIPALEIRERIPAQVWDRYLKFTVVRNPWDRMVSLYYWFGGGDRYASFMDFLLHNADAVGRNWQRYTDDDTPIVDEFVRYENLAADLAEISGKIGLPENLAETMRGIRGKGQYRDRSKTLRSFYPPESDEYELVRLLGKKEIDYFGYAFHG